MPDPKCPKCLGAGWLSLPGEASLRRCDCKTPLVPARPVWHDINSANIADKEEYIPSAAQLLQGARVPPTEPPVEAADEIDFAIDNEELVSMLSSQDCWKVTDKETPRAYVGDRILGIVFINNMADASVVIFTVEETSFDNEEGFDLADTLCWAYERDFIRSLNLSKEKFGIDIPKLKPYEPYENEDDD